MWYDLFIPRGVIPMAVAVKKTISLPPDLAREVDEMAREEGIPVSAVIQNALRQAKRERLKKSFYQAQNYWSRKAKEKGILSERDLDRYVQS
jgi:predicted transcriptional regulator